MSNSKYASVDEAVKWTINLIKAVHTNEYKSKKRRLSPSRQKVENSLDAIAKLLKVKLEEKIDSKEKANLGRTLAETLTELGLLEYPTMFFSSFSEVKRDYFVGISHTEHFPSKEYTSKTGMSYQIDGSKKEYGLLIESITGKPFKQPKIERIKNAIKSIKIR